MPGVGKVKIFIIGIHMGGLRSRQLQAVEEDGRRITGIGCIDLQPATVLHRSVEAVAKRDRSGACHVQDRGIDARAFRSAGPCSGNHRAVAFYAGRPAISIDVKIGKEPATALKIPFYLGEANPGTGIEIVGNTGCV